MLLESARSVYKAGQKSISRTCPTPFGVAPNYILPYGPLVSSHWPMVLGCTNALTKEEKMAPNLNSFQMVALCWFFISDSDFCIVMVLHFRLWLLHQYPGCGMWHLLGKSKLVTSHLRSLQTFSFSRVDSISMQPYQLLSRKQDFDWYSTKKRLVSRNILMDHGCRPEKAAVFWFYTPWHGAAQLCTL